MTQHPDLFAALAAPFEPSEIKTRSHSGRQLSYITARTVMNRLDAVLGPENWWDRFIPGEKSVQCELTIRLPDGSMLTKSDAGGYAGMADLGDDDKSGYSDAFKRTAVKFGVARYLYGDGIPGFVAERVGASTTASASPTVQASVSDSRSDGPSSTPASAHSSGSAGGRSSLPRTGKALFAWTKDQEQRHSVGLLKYLNNWAKLQEFPGRMVEWDAEQVALAHTEACRKLSSLQAAATSEAYEEALAN